MALTPEDVHNKTFGNSRLGRKGYDETEVDDFLDEVYDEMTRLGRENEELTTKLNAAQRALAAAQEQLRTAQTVQSGGTPVPAPAPVAAPPAPTPAPAAAPSAPAAPAQPPSEAAAGIIAMAQRVADEHVSEAKHKADNLLGEARGRADALAREAEDRHRQVLGTLEGERVSLERRVEELRAFEREYRSRLKSYLESQLRDLDSRAPAASTQPAAARPVGGPAGHDSAPPPRRSSPFNAAPAGGTEGAPAGPPAGTGFLLDEGTEGR